MKLDRLLCRASALPVLALSFSTAVSAQTLSELDSLIFEPVPLPAVEEAAPGSLPSEGSTHALAPAPPSPVLSVPEPPALTPVPAGLAPATLAPAALNPTAFDAGSAPIISDETTLSTEVYEDVIQEIAMEDGPYTPELRQELLALGELYQQQGEHEQALEVFARAEQLARVNGGLYSLDQVPSIENMIESLVALGLPREANEKHEYLIYLHEQHYGKDDPGVIPALLKQAEWHMQAFQKGVRFEADSMFIADPSGASTEKGVRRQAFRELARAQGAYLRSIQILLEQQLYRDPRLIELERRLIEIYFLHAHRESILDSPENYLNVHRVSTGSLIRHRPNRSHTPSYHFGSEGYTRILAYQQHDPNTTPLEYARTLMEQGDWYMLFARRAVAQDKYEEAHELLREEGYAAEDIEELLRPDVPLMLPTFTPTPHSRAMLMPEGGEVEWRGWIDLSFTISDYGKAGDIQTLGKSPNTSVAVERRLTRLLRQSQFRPRFSEEAGNDEVRLRYFYSY